MINSIRYFEEECINRFENLEDQFLKHPDKLAEYVLGLTAELHQLGLKMIQESLEMMNRMLLESPIRKRDWVVEYYGAAEPPVRCGESHLSGLTEPPIDSYSA